VSDPYGSLEPSSGRPQQPAVLEPGGSTALIRGARKRCPRCGERRIWDGWFTVTPVCTTCSLRFEEEEGGFLGAMTLNYVFAFGLWVAVLIVVLVLTVPDVPVAPLLIMSVVVLVLVPLWAYPRAKMTWAAIEWMAHRTDPDYRARGPRDPKARDLE
jgi:uncharacterized protein (DUF983 family)